MVNKSPAEWAKQCNHIESCKLGDRGSTTSFSEISRQVYQNGFGNWVHPNLETNTLSGVFGKTRDTLKSRISYIWPSAFQFVE